MTKMKNFLPDITQIPMRSPFLKRKKSCPLSGENAPKIDYKDTKLLKKYLSENRSTCHQVFPYCIF